uniref:Sec1 family domain containing 1 n=1 Tax=Anas platyrhynchos platyrhynchos TaxID=8840 RepID=A0A493TZD3_ANAPP
MAAGIREKQTVALKRMLNFNVPPVKNSTGEPVWKVLIYDRFGQDIISPLLSVKELRDMGITLHLLLHSDRDPIPDVPAIYFVMPTEENIDRMCQDLRNQLYESYYLNFISAISRSKLEDIANAAIGANAVTQVAKVFDQYLNFITLEDDMFVLCNQNKELVSYRAINRPDITDTEMETIMDTIVDSLFCFFVTLGAIPIIRCSRGTAAEMVAVKLDKKLRENLRDARNSLFTGDTLGAGQFSFQRPLLVLVDRNIDLATPLHHTWTYQALVHDVLTCMQRSPFPTKIPLRNGYGKVGGTDRRPLTDKMWRSKEGNWNQSFWKNLSVPELTGKLRSLDFHLNRVNLEESTGTESIPAGARPKKKNKKSYDLTASDKFWQKHKGSPFPEVAESVQQELESYRAQEDEVKRLKSIMGIEGEDEGAISMLSDNTAKLTSAVSSLPELLEKKRLIDLHTNVATAVLEHIKARKLDVYFEYEEKIMSKSTLDKSLLDMISDPDAGTPEDKMRLFLIYYISSTQAPSEIDLEQYKKALTDAGCNLAPLNYIKQWKAFTKMASAPTSYGNTTPKPLGLFSRVMNTGSQFVMEGVKNLVLKQQNLPVTRILDNLMEMKSNPETDDYRYFDPKMLRGSDSSVPRNKNPFQEAIVFVVGGGNYIEYQNLIDYIKGKQGKHVLYGCSELFNATQFIKQLSQLGQK